ncbi:MAG: ABC transporter ATP-binding protein [Caldilineaceae bacterium]|nr:ABC transporter ATP-binding protein [Caldilineaceae bacterium]MCY4092078.1 ABC transporter ATP-binding protein [Caldilineaceae bacterium]MCY4117526.1 ABC transporter ATP-binding protein [Caldilineaceae bacterium]MDE0431398.1 ABC transporter ATP-binding protein [Caldilineaceae bacterium]
MQISGPAKRIELGDTNLAMNQDALLEIKNLKTHFHLQEGIVRAVDGVSLEIERGRTLGIIGESGCGKSVTAHSILRLVPSPPGNIVDGEILLHRRENGQNTSRQEEETDLARLDPRGAEIRAIRGAEISMVFQEPMTSFGPMHTIGNQIMESILLHQEDVDSDEARELAIENLRRVGIPRPVQIVDAYPHQLSGGMRQRAMIAMALSCSPRLLIADEPTTALDVTIQAQILELLTTLQEEFGMAIIFITHNLGVIAEVADEVAVMYLGRIVEQAGVIELFDNPQHPYTQGLLDSIPHIDDEKLPRLRAIEGVVPDPYQIPSGCAFSDRCPSFMPGTCDKAMPDLAATGEGHLVRCFLYSEAEEG